MSAHNRVVWSEGLFLQPQHFQQQDRYLERYIESRCQALIPYSWGFTEIEIERDFLRIGKFGLRRAAGVFPDGTPVRMPDDDPLPEPIDIGAQTRDQILHLAVPLRR
jgi:type VI secretion system protein ImpJ